MVSHNSHRLDLFFFILFFFFYSDWMVSNVLSSRSPIFASEWLVFVDALYCIFSFHSLYSSVLEFLFFYFLWILSLNCTSCFVHVLFSWFHWVVYPCSLVCWVSLKILILNFFSNLYISISLVSVTEKLLYSFDDVMFTWFFMFLVALVDVYTFFGAITPFRYTNWFTCR